MTTRSIHYTMKFRKSVFTLLMGCLAVTAFAGDPGGGTEDPTPKKHGDDHENKEVHNTFTDTRLINSHTIRTIEKRNLEFRITHRFGDLAGENGGAETMFGTDNAADIRFAFEYGITDELSVGIGRNKGAGPLTRIFDGYAKYRFLTQTTDNSMPVGMAVMLGTGYTSMPESSNLTSPSAFEGSSTRRMSYVSQLMISRKFGDRFSLQLMPTYVHRNFVAFGDENSILSVGAGGRLKVNKVIGLMVEYFHNLGDTRIVQNIEYQNPLAFGLEFDTGGHVFSLVVTNSRGINETQFIPYTSSKYDEGQFRWGFTISRPFRL